MVVFGVGCVDLTPPWKVSDASMVHPGPVADAADGASPQDLDSAQPVDGNEDGPRPLSPDAAVDTGTKPPVPDAGPRDSLVEIAPLKLDAKFDLPPQPGDAQDAAEILDTRIEPSDVLKKEDLSSDLAPPSPDLQTPDIAPDTAPVSTLTQGLLAHYRCEGSRGSTLPDISGNKKDALMVNGAGGSLSAAFAFGVGKLGNALVFKVGEKAHVNLPKGIVSTQRELSIAAWVKLNSGTSFQRIFDFGMDTNTFMYLANSNGSGVRFRIYSAAMNKNQVVDGIKPIPTGNWIHVLVTMGDDGISIYFDGARVAQQAPAILRPADLGETGNNYLGRSPFSADPYFDGQLDDLRLYNRVLTAAEITELVGLQ